jgi:outer membrane receptor protein involved in Fe transport
VQATPEAAVEEAIPDDTTGETIEISGEAPAESASSVHLGPDLLKFRPKTQPSDLLRQVPGLVVSQHAGGGKSDQYFIRGFDADHGTDIAIFIDGIPVNLTSHGHGQGYADTHWLIPETVETVDMHKGPYAARYGDFYTAGALELKTIDKVDANTVWVAASAPLASTKKFERYDRRLVGMASPELRKNSGDKSLIAMQIAESDGPFLNAQNFRQGNALIKWKGKIGPGQLALATTWYAARWNQSGQLPSLEIDAGRLDRFGAIDPTEGGVASRTSASIGYSVHDDETRSTWRVMGYGVGNRLRLYSNFTLFARDIDNGDQIEQTDSRFLYGFDAAYERWIEIGPVAAFITAGAQVRADDVETSLWHDSQRFRLADCFMEGLNPCNHTYNRIRDAALYVEANVIPTSRVHIFPGIRVDSFTWDVEDLDEDTVRDPMLTTGGSAQRAIVSPKLSVEATVLDQLSLFANGGLGFHSNDARAAVSTRGNGAVARAYGAEAGARAKPYKSARVSADFWYLHLTSEQVWSGDAGGTEPSEATRRYGVDVEGSIDVMPWLSVDANLTWARSTLVKNQGNAGALALAPKFMGSGGVAIHDKRGFASIRARGIGDRPGNDDGSLTAEGYLIVDLIAGRQLTKHFNLELTITNLLNAKWREAQFAEESRVSPTADLLEQMHFTPGLPLTATIKLAASM